MIFGKHINRYYIRYGGMLLVGLLSLIVVHYFQLTIPKMYQMIINGMNTGQVTAEGVTYAFDMDFLFNRVCIPMLES